MSCLLRTAGERGTESPSELQAHTHNQVALPSCDSPLHWQQQQQQQQQGRPRILPSRSMQVPQHTGPAAADASQRTKQLRHRAASVPPQQPVHHRPNSTQHNWLKVTSAPQQQEQQQSRRLQEHQEQRELRELLKLKQLLQLLQPHHPPAAGPDSEADLLQDPILRALLQDSILRALLQEDMAQQEEQRGGSGGRAETGRASHRQQQWQEHQHQQAQEGNHNHNPHNQHSEQQARPSPVPWPDMLPGSSQHQQQHSASCRTSAAAAPGPGLGLGPDSNHLLPLPTAEPSAAMALGVAPAQDPPFHSHLQQHHHHRLYHHQHVPGAKAGQAGQPQPLQKQPQQQQVAAGAADIGAADGTSWHEQQLLYMDTRAGSGDAPGLQLAAGTAPLQQQLQQLPALRLLSTEFNLPMARAAATEVTSTYDYPDELLSPTGLMPCLAGTMPSLSTHAPGWPEPSQHAMRRPLLLSPPHKRRRWEPSADEGWPADLDPAGGSEDMPAQHAAAGPGHLCNLLTGPPVDALLAGGGNGELAAGTHIHRAHVNGTQPARGGTERQSNGSGMQRQGSAAAQAQQNDGGSLAAAAAAGPLAAWVQGDPLPAGLEAVISRVARRDIHLLLRGVVWEAVQAAVGPAVKQALQLLLEA